MNALPFKEERSKLISLSNNAAYVVHNMSSDLCCIIFMLYNLDIFIFYGEIWQLKHLLLQVGDSRVRMQKHSSDRLMRVGQMCARKKPCRVVVPYVNRWQRRAIPQLILRKRLCSKKLTPALSDSYQNNKAFLWQKTFLNYSCVKFS